MTTLVSADGRWQWNGRRWKAVTNAEGEVQPWTEGEAAEITELNTSPGYQASSHLTASEESALEGAFAETSFFEGVGTPIGETTALLGAEAGAAAGGSTGKTRRTKYTRR